MWIFFQIKNFWIKPTKNKLYLKPSYNNSYPKYCKAFLMGKMLLTKIHSTQFSKNYKKNSLIRIIKWISFAFRSIRYWLFLQLLVKNFFGSTSLSPSMLCTLTLRSSLSMWHKSKVYAGFWSYLHCLSHDLVGLLP